MNQTDIKREGTKVLIVCNDLAYFRAHRENLALALAHSGYDVLVAAGHYANIDLSDWPANMRFMPLQIDRHRMRPLHDLKLIHSIRKIQSDFSPDIVHAITIKPILYGSLALSLARGNKPPMIWTFPGLGKVFEDASSIANKLRKMIVGLLLKLAQSQVKVVATFENIGDRKRMIATGIFDSDQCHRILGTGLSRKHHTWNGHKSLKDGRLTVLLATRLLREKGVDTFIDTARAMRDQPFSFQLAGPFDETNPDCMPKKDVLAAHERGELEYLGVLSPEETFEAMKEAHIFCLPTRLSEGFPRSLLEAGAAACCLVGSQQPAIEPLIEEGINGKLILKPDSENLQQSLQSLGQNTKAVLDMGERSRDAVRDMAVWDEDIVAAFMKIYDTVLTQDGRD